MRIILSSLLALLMAGPVQAKSGATSIPFTINSGGLLMLDATANGIPIHVILDTGAGLDVLAPSLIQRLNGKPAGIFTAFRMTGERMDIQLFTIPELSVGPVVRKDFVVGSLALLDQLHIDGIVSLSDLRQQPFTLDFVGKKLILETSRTLARRRAAGSTSSLQVDEERGIALDVFASFLIGNQPGQCEIDTGSQGPTINLRYMALLGIAKDGKDVRKLEVATIAGGKQVRYDTTIPHLALAEAPAIAVEEPGVSFSDIIYNCVIGTYFWRDRAVTFDVPSRQLIVSTPSAVH